jgi:predicted permease
MAKILNLFPWRRRRLEQDLDRELRYHVERRVEDLRGSGLSEAEARRRAALELGGINRVQEEVRDTWIWRWLDDRGRDLRYACRMLARSPGFTAAATLSLALGIGANAGIFSLVDQVLLRRLPVKEPERLVLLEWRGSSLADSWGSGNLMSYPLCRDLQEQSQFFDGVFCRYATTVNFSTGQQHDPVSAEIVSGSYFPVLGVRPEFGRLIDPSDDLQPGAHPVVVLSHNYWTNNLGGAQDVIGRKVLVNNHPMTVIGIAPASFRGVDVGAVPSLWIPAMMKREATPEWDRLLDRRAVWMHVFGRLKPGITAEQTKTELQPWFKSMLEADTLREGFPRATAEQRRGFLASTIDLLPAAQGRSDLRGALRRPLWVLMGGTLLLLLLASLNVAGLLLARGAARSREMSTRMALGASRGRITGQLVVEAMLITFGGGWIGLLAAPIVSQALLSFLSPDAALSSRIDGRVFLFAFVMSMVTTGLCGLAPALQSGRVPLIAGLKERARMATAGGVRFRRALVIGQLAFSLILLTGAGLFVQTLTRLHAKAPASASNLLLFRADPPAIGYSDSDARRLMRDLLRKLQEVPGVESAAVANTSLLMGGSFSRVLTVQSDERVVTDRPVYGLRVTPGYFSTLGTRVIAGRDFNERDTRDPQSPGYRSAIVNESFARRYFGSRSPLGHHLGIGSRADLPANIEIVGVIEDFSYRSLRLRETEHVFFPFWDQQSEDGTFYVKVQGRPESAFASIRAAVAQLDPTLPLGSLRTFEDQIDRSLTTERMLATLSSGFGAIALLLSVVGLYGVMSFVVTRRTQEIGLRLALGATRPAAVWLIIRDAVVMIGAGTAVALPCAWALSRLVEAQLFGVRAVDGPTIAAASCLLTLVGLGAAMLPAWRAASVSPTEALRLE